MCKKLTTVRNGFIVINVVENVTKNIFVKNNRAATFFLEVSFDDIFSTPIFLKNNICRQNINA